MKKALSILLVGLIASLFGSLALAGTEITVIMPDHEADILGYFEQKALSFEKKTGTKVNIVSASWDRVADKLLPALAAGSSAYDVCEFDNCWVAQFAETEWLLPLDDYAGVEYVEDMLPALNSLFSAKEHLYGVTWNNDMRFFMYNARMLKDAGIAGPPLTWNELIEQSRRLMAAGTAKYGFIEGWEMGQALANAQTVLVHSFGGRLLDEKGNPTLDSSECVAALQLMVDLLHKYKIINPASLTSSQEVSQNVFLRGDTTFFPQAWPGLYSYSRSSDVSNIIGEVEVAPKPLGVTKDMGAALSLPEALAIPKTSRHPDEAWAFIQFISNKKTNKAQSLAIGSLPIWTELFNDPELLRLYPYWKQFGKQAKYLHGLPQVTWYSEFSRVCQVEVMNALTQVKTVEKATKDMMRAVEAIEK